MRKWIIAMSVSAALAFLGAGCRKAEAPPPPAPPAVNTSAAPVASDPLSDDLDAAIEDLNAIE